jgi:hypothetical protein
MENELHDAVLENVVIDWSRGHVDVSLRTGEGPRSVSVEGVTDLRMSRRMPWGPSSRVNTFLWDRHGPGLRAEIGMQSGDSIVINGSDLSIVDERI